jgi:hypothetical protein
MPGRKSNERRSSGGKRKSGGSQAQRFVYEPGEKSLNMKATSGAVKLSASTGQAEFRFPPLPPGPDHLRALGWRITASFLGEGAFLDGVSPVKTKSLSVPASQEEDNDGDIGPTPPAVTVIGPPGTTTLVVCRVQFLYKEH